jgi:hypothetical protein
VDKTLAAVHERLTKEIDYWSDRFIKLRDDKAAGKDVRLNLENVRRPWSFPLDCYANYAVNPYLRVLHSPAIRKLGHVSNNSR